MGQIDAKQAWYKDFNGDLIKISDRDEVSNLRNQLNTYTSAFPNPRGIAYCYASSEYVFNISYSAYLTGMGYLDYSYSHGILNISGSVLSSSIFDGVLCIAIPDGYSVTSTSGSYPRVNTRSTFLSASINQIHGKNYYCVEWGKSFGAYPYFNANLQNVGITN